MEANEFTFGYTECMMIPTASGNWQRWSHGCKHRWYEEPAQNSSRVRRESWADPGQWWETFGVGEGPEAEAQLENGSLGSQGKRGFQKREGRIVSDATNRSNR